MMLDAYGVCLHAQNMLLKPPPRARAPLSVVLTCTSCVRFYSQVQRSEVLCFQATRASDITWYLRTTHHLKHVRNFPIFLATLLRTYAIGLVSLVKSLCYFPLFRKSSPLLECPCPRHIAAVVCKLEAGDLFVQIPIDFVMEQRWMRVHVLLSTLLTPAPPPPSRICPLTIACARILLSLLAATGTRADDARATGTWAAVSPPPARVWHFAGSLLRQRGRRRRQHSRRWLCQRRVVARRGRA